MSEKGKKRVEEMSRHWTGSERDTESPMLQTSFLRCGMLVEEKVRHRASEWRQWRRLHATFGGCGKYLMFNSGGGGRRGRLTSGGIRRHKASEDGSPVRIPISGKWKDRIPYNVRYGVVQITGIKQVLVQADLIDHLSMRRMRQTEVQIQILIGTTYQGSKYANHEVLIFLTLDLSHAHMIDGSLKPTLYRRRRRAEPGHSWTSRKEAGGDLPGLKYTIHNVLRPSVRSSQLCVYDVHLGSRYPKHEVLILPKLGIRQPRGPSLTVSSLWLSETGFQQARSPGIGSPPLKITVIRNLDERKAEARILRGT
ncbi:hypothetical protein C8J57DRAFT_1231603 [Mycena rebaudengoi]|nr:hypothetical protein C8J57DRAFT_1231603 [Mycena rebaudengoi]